MTIPQRHEIEARIEVLERKLAARQGKPGFAGNCEAIKVVIGELNELLAQADAAAEAGAARLAAEAEQADLTPAP